jgi:uncharacterized protein
MPILTRQIGSPLQCLGVFAKFWEPGQVKTRLGEAIGMQKSAELHRLFVGLTVARFQHSAGLRQLFVSPPEKTDAVRSWMDSVEGGLQPWEIQPQRSGDLGTRIVHFFDNAFGSGDLPVVLIGSDSPTLPITFVGEAFARLKNTDVVFGPASDGGYYLVGLNQPRPVLFRNIAWSSPDVLSESLKIARAESLRVELLPEWYDVDRIEDLPRLREDLEKQRNGQINSESERLLTASLLQTLREVPCT